MDAYRDGATIIAPRRAEGTDALGDAWIALQPDTAEYRMWDDWLHLLAGHPIEAAAGHDTHPGGEQLKHWWVYGGGAARWTSFTELYAQLRAEITDMSDDRVKAIAAAWFHLRFGYWPGDHRNVHARYNPAQKRDPNGEWGDGMPGASAVKDALSALTGQAALDATPARLVGSGHPPGAERFKPGRLEFSSGEPAWSPEQRAARVAALEGYQGEDFRAINRSLRGMLTDDRYLQEYAYSNRIDPTGARSHLNEQIDRIDDVMDASELTDAIRVLRGTQTGRGVFGDRLGGDLTGFEWTEDAYVSTTADSDVGDFTRTGLSMEIAVPAGTKAVNLSGFTTAGGGGDEAEILLERGLRMRVVSDTGPGNPRHLKVEVVNG